MDFQAYLGLTVIVVGLTMSVVGVSHRDYADALHSVVFSLLGALLLTGSLVEPGWTARIVLGCIFLVATAMRFAAWRLGRRKDGARPTG